MAPPGIIPEGYEGVPSSFMKKIPVPAGEDSNTRAITIFFSYLLLCFSLTVFIVLRLLKTYVVLSKSRTARPPPRKHVYLFAILAFLSLSTTWYHMFQYFQLSYKQWLGWRSWYELTPDQKHWGLWLRHTSLFREAWETTVVGFARYWWTHQIFFFACALGLDLERLGVPRGIKHTWAFMLLGQIVAISFATNLFLLAVILSPPAVKPSPSSDSNQKKLLGPVISLLATLATLVPAYQLSDDHYWHHSTDFMPMLLIPHIALMVLPVVRGLLPAKAMQDYTPGFTEAVYKWLWRVTACGGITLLVWQTQKAVGYGGWGGILSAIFEHPAVSSVGTDVLFCWLTWYFWWFTQRNSGVENPRFDENDDNDSWVGAGSSTTVSGGGESRSEMRRR